ncbi:pullulanase [Geobacillus stearothermophilus]|nr:pullulanase [Geobacillus stearothermophilus]
MLHISRTFAAYLDEIDQITVIVPKARCLDNMEPFVMTAPSGEDIPLVVQQKEDLGDINGFRFDLMGVHDIETMKSVRDALDAIDPSILVYGEGWDLPTPLAPEQKATMANTKRLPRLAYF